MSGPGLLTATCLEVALAGRKILQEIELSLQARQVVALVGPNGAGKTTLLRALAGLVPSNGTIKVQDRLLASMSLRDRARAFAYLPQGHVAHWPLQAREIVALGRYPHGATDPGRLSPADEAAVARAMQLTNVENLGERRITELSGGERSRVALARVFANEAAIVLADEPTASLDPRHQIEVMTHLRRAANAGTLVLVVTHDLGLAARFADMVLVLSQGRIAATGGPAEALSAKVIAEVFGVSVYRAEHDHTAVVVPWAGL